MKLNISVLTLTGSLILYQGAQSLEMVREQAIDLDRLWPATQILYFKNNLLLNPHSIKTQTRM